MLSIVCEAVCVRLSVCWVVCEVQCVGLCV